MRWCSICQQPWSFAYCGQHREQRQPQAGLSASPHVPCAASATLDLVYRSVLAELPLAAHHRQALRKRGLTDEEIVRRGYRTFPMQGRAVIAKRLIERFGDVCAQVPGFYLAGRNGRRWWSLSGSPGLVVPGRSLDGHVIALKVRADAPVKGPKYTMIISAKYGDPSPGAQVHVPLFGGVCGDTVRLNEGELKSDIALVLSSVMTISVPGVALWRKALPVLQALRPRQVLLAFDSDWQFNSHVAHAFGQAAFTVLRAGYEVQVETWDPTLGKGIDDLLVAGYAPAVQSVALAFGAGLRGQARIWTGHLRTVAAAEVPPWH